MEEYISKSIVVAEIEKLKNEVNRKESNMKVKIKNKIIDVPSYFEVRDNILYNNNTKKYEGVDGDIITVTEFGETKKGHVKGYTECQIIPTYEWSTMIVSAQGLHDGLCRIDITHCTPVYEA